MLDLFLKTLAVQYDSGDFDSDHPVCMWLINKYDLDEEEGLWFTILTMAYYNEVSAWIAFNNSQPFVPPKGFYNLPIDKNRRNLYGKIATHLESVCLQRRTHKGWPYHNFNESRAKNWDRLKFNLGECWGNGRFAIYNTADMMHKVNGAAVVVTDLENRASSGPADAIWRICEGRIERNDIAGLDAEGESIYFKSLTTKHAPCHPFYTKADRGTLESVLCNFSGMCRGKFYPGRNIDRQQARIMFLERDRPQYRKLLRDLWDARAEVFNHKYLGEYSGWEGINKQRMKHYKLTEEILWPCEQR